MTFPNKLTQILTLVVLPLAVTACAGSTASTSVKPDVSVTQKCRKPVDLPDRALTQAEAEKYWQKDRLSLLQCGYTKETLVKWLKANGRL